MHMAPAIDLAATNNGPLYPNIYAFATGLATTILYSLFALQKMRLYHEGVLLGALIYHILVHKICCQKVDCIDICIPPNNPGMFGG